MNEVTDEQRAMLLSATRMMLGQVRTLVHDSQMDLAWEKVYGSNPKRLVEAEGSLRYNEEIVASWELLLKTLR